MMPVMRGRANVRGSLWALFPSADRGGVVKMKLTESELTGCLHDFEELQGDAELTDGQVLFWEASFLKCLVRLAREYARDEQGDLLWPRVVVRGLAVIKQISPVG
jgi:hypothetical protein